MSACLPAGKPAQEILSILSILNLPGAEILARLRHLPLKPWRRACRIEIEGGQRI
jgi:hypothetical protein